MPERKRDQRQYDLIQQYLPGLILSTILKIVNDLGDPYTAKPGLGGMTVLPGRRPRQAPRWSAAEPCWTSRFPRWWPLPRSCTAGPRSAGSGGADSGQDPGSHRHTDHSGADPQEVWDICLQPAHAIEDGMVPRCTRSGSRTGSPRIPVPYNSAPETIRGRAGREFKRRASVEAGKLIATMA